MLFSREGSNIDDEKVVMKAIKKCTKSLGKCSVEQIATLMAWSEKNDLHVDKYRKKVLQDLEKEDSDWNLSCNICFNLYCINLNKCNLCDIPIFLKQMMTTIVTMDRTMNNFFLILHHSIKIRKRILKIQLSSGVFGSILEHHCKFERIKVVLGYLFALF